MIRFALIVMFFVSMAVARTVTGQTSGQGEAVEVSGSGKINWTRGEVYATGIGAPPAQQANQAQARAMAERAAVVVAYRNLLEVVKGVRVDSETVVENFMVKSDMIRTRVDGIVRGARVVKTQYMSDGSVEVLVAMPMRGDFMDTLVPESFGRPAAKQLLTPVPAMQKTVDVKPLPTLVKPLEPAKPSISPAASVPEKKPDTPKQSEPLKPASTVKEDPTVAFKGGMATGLVIDGRGLGLRPALLPRIVDTQGQEIYVGQIATRTNAVEQGVAGYAKDVNAAANNFRVTDNPAVIKGLRAAGSARTDIVVGQADAETLRQLSSKGNFLQYCRVIIVY